MLILNDNHWAKLRNHWQTVEASTPKLAEFMAWAVSQNRILEACVALENIQCMSELDDSSDFEAFMRNARPHMLSEDEKTESGDDVQLPVSHFNKYRGFVSCFND